MKPAIDAVQTVNGNYEVVINGHVYAILANTPALGWKIMSRTAARKNGRNHYETPEAAIKAYYGRKATFFKYGEGQ